MPLNRRIVRKVEVDGPYFPLRWEIDLDDCDDPHDVWVKHDITDALNYIRKTMSLSSDVNQIKSMEFVFEPQTQDCPEILKLLEED